MSSLGSNQPTSVCSARRRRAAVNGLTLKRESGGDDRSEAVLGGAYCTEGEHGTTHRGRLPVTTTRNREIDRMALAHACIAVLPHPLSSRGETCEKDDEAEVARVRANAGHGARAGNGRRGRRRRQGCRRRRSQSNGNFFLARLPAPCVPLFLPPVYVGELFSGGPRFALSRFSIRPFTRIAERTSLSKVYYNRSREERIVLERIFFSEKLAKAYSRLRTNRVFQNNVKLPNIGHLHSIVLDNVTISMFTVALKLFPHQ